MWNEVGRASLKPQNANTLHRLSQRQRHLSFVIFDTKNTAHHAQTHSSVGYTRNTGKIWEFYCNRDDILLELAGKSATFFRINSVKAIGFLLIGCYAAQALALVGVIGDKGEGLQDWAQDDQCWRPIVSSISQLGKQIQVCSRGIGGNTLFQCGRQYKTLSVKALISSFLVVEGLSFAGIIGEPGESFAEWIDSHDKKAEWVKQTKQFGAAIRKYVSWDALETFYEAAVDEEKVACAGFAIGSLMAMFT